MVHMLIDQSTGMTASFVVIPPLMLHRVEILMLRPGLKWCGTTQHLAAAYPDFNNTFNHQPFRPSATN